MRRIALFGATVLLPCLMLAAIGFVIIRQDRELASRHAEDQQRAAAAERRIVRLARLEKMKRAAMEDFFAGRRVQVDFAAVVAEDHVRAPWQESAVPNVELESCEQAEFVAGRQAEAIACYENILRGPGPARLKSLALLRLGRVLARSGEARRAQAANLELLSVPFEHRDDEGIPLAYYAADRLLRSPGAHAAVGRRLRQAPLDATPHSPPAAYLLKSIAERLGDAALRERAIQAVAHAQQVESLRTELPAMLPLLRREGAEPVWVEQGAWEVSLTKTPESGKELLVGIAKGRLPAEAAVALAEAAPSRTEIYGASLGLVVLIAVSGAWLLWRDVRRDTVMAEMRSQFVSSVSHELKTPLTAIRMFAETLRIRPSLASGSREEYLDTIIHESERLSRLVDNVLDFSKLEQGRKQYQLRPTAVEPALEAVVRTAAYPLEQAGVSLRWERTGPLPEVMADTDALQQAVLNLVMNAMKYAGTRKEIELAAGEERGCVVITVRDFGAGIPAEHQKRIFQRFYRVPSEENRQVPGAGLGLTIVAHIAKAHGGAVTVESEPGAGSVFRLRLPVEGSA